MRVTIRLLSIDFNRLLGYYHCVSLSTAQFEKARRRGGMTGREIAEFHHNVQGLVRLQETDSEVELEGGGPAKEVYVLVTFDGKTFKDRSSLSSERFKSSAHLNKWLGSIIEHLTHELPQRL